MENMDAYIKRCRRKLQAMGAPLTGWMCIGVRDEEQDSFTCELCGCTRVRYVHEMYHSSYPDNICVGCICAGVMEGDIEAAQNRERLMKNRANRRKTFVQDGWTENNNGVFHKRHHGVSCRIMRDKFHRPRYGVWHKNRWNWHYRGKPISSFEQAASILFNTIDKPIEVANARENH